MSKMDFVFKCLVEICVHRNESFMNIQFWNI